MTKDTVTVTLAEGICDGDLRVIDLIVSLQKALAGIPEEFRDIATLEIYAYDWEGSEITYTRPMTQDELDSREAAIEKQRLAADAGYCGGWLRNVRMNVTSDRAEAEAFIRSSSEANKYHPDVYVKPTFVESTDDDRRPWGL